MLNEFLKNEGAKVGADGIYVPPLENVPQSVVALASVIAFWALANKADPGASLDAAIAQLAGDESEGLRSVLGIYRRVLAVQWFPSAVNDALRAGVLSGGEPAIS
jgi:hypothetical protein